MPKPKITVLQYMNIVFKYKERLSQKIVFQLTVSQFFLSFHYQQWYHLTETNNLIVLKRSLDTSVRMFTGTADIL